MVKVPESTRPRTEKACPCSSVRGRGCNDFTSISVYPSSLRRVSNSCLFIMVPRSWRRFTIEQGHCSKNSAYHLKDPFCMPRPLINRVSQFLQLAPGTDLMAFYFIPIPERDGSA